MAELELIAAGLFLTVFLILMLFFTAQSKRGAAPQLRRIQGYTLLQKLTGRAIEAGKTLHLSLGIGGVTNETTGDSLAGLSVLGYLAKKAAITGIAPIVSMANPLLMLYAQNVLRAAHSDDPKQAKNSYANVRWIAPQPTAYAAGVMNLLTIDKAEANIMVGSFGDEYLLMGEVAARHNVTHIGGSSHPNVLPFIYASADETLLGEEIYAAKAYLEQDPAHIGSLVAQDSMRWLIFFVIIGGVVVTTLFGPA